MKQFYRKNDTIREFSDPENSPELFEDHNCKSINHAKRRSRELQNQEIGSHNGKCLRTTQKLPSKARQSL